MKSTTLATVIKVADEVWIAAALLQREHPAALDFSIEEIVRRATEEGIAGGARPGIYVHVVQHCVANRPPNPGRYRMLFETRSGRRRLFRPGDTYDSRRGGSKITPKSEDVPEPYRDLILWYRAWSGSSGKPPAQPDPLLQLRGSGKHLWEGESADEYVRRLREGWA